jgi:hypothetical protein
MTIQQQEQRERALSRSGATCPVCGGSIYAHGTPQFAHKLSNSKMNRAKFGSFIIDHTLNGDYTCSLECNGRLLIDNKPRQILMLLADIVMDEIKNFDR